jgi:hypothetical protein
MRFHHKPSQTMGLAARGESGMVEPLGGAISKVLPPCL